MLHHVVVYRLVQIELAIEYQWLGNGFNLLGLLIGCYKPNDWLIQGLNHRIGIAVDGGIENVAAMNIAIGGNICAATGQTKAKGGSGS